MTIKGYSETLLLQTIIDGITDKKGLDILKLNLSQIDSAICDYFIICHGNSSTQADAIANNIEYVISTKTKFSLWGKEGYENSQWIVLDYGNVMVHIFQKQQRDYYDLEELWADAIVTKIKTEY